MTHKHFKVSMILTKKRKNGNILFWAAFGLLLTAKFYNTYYDKPPPPKKIDLWLIGWEVIIKTPLNLQLAMLSVMVWLKQAPVFCITPAAAFVKAVNKTYQFHNVYIAYRLATYFWASSINQILNAFKVCFGTHQLLNNMSGTFAAKWSTTKRCCATHTGFIWTFSAKKKQKTAAGCFCKSG